MPVTMKDIARIAGVSRQAVAAALSLGGTSKVSGEMCLRIRGIAEGLGYTPNQAAQRLKGAATRTVGVYGVPFVSVLNQSFFHGLSVELDRHGYNLMACYGMDDEAEVRAIRELLAKGLDGMIITTQTNPLAAFAAPPVPSVFCPPAKIDGFDVAVDHAAGMFQATEALVKMGRKRIGYLLPCLTDTVGDQPNREKRDGIERALAAHGLELTLLTVTECGGDGARIVGRLRELSLDAVLCSNDYFAGRLLAMLLSCGVRVPQEVMVVGYDGLSLCDLCAVPLATVVQPILRQAELAVEILLERICHKENAAAPRHISLEPYFYPSASCGVANPRNSQIPIHSSFSCMEMIWRQNEFPNNAQGAS